MNFMTFIDNITQLKKKIGKHTPPYCSKEAVSCSLEIEASCSGPIGNSPVEVEVGFIASKS
jgi:hypothetical protein